MSLLGLAFLLYFFYLHLGNHLKDYCGHNLFTYIIDRKMAPRSNGTGFFNWIAFLVGGRYSLSLRSGKVNYLAKIRYPWKHMELREHSWIFILFWKFLFFGKYPSSKYFYVNISLLILALRIATRECIAALVMNAKTIYTFSFNKQLLFLPSPRKLFKLF